MDSRLLSGIRIVTVLVLVAAVFSFVLMAQAPNPVGEWNMQTDVQGQITKFTMTVAKEGEAFKAKIASEQYGPQDLSDFKFENATITFTRNLDVGGQVIEMLFKGKIEGDKIAGAYSVQGVDLPVTGTRKTAATTGK